MRIGDGYTGPDMVSTAAWVSAAVVLSLGLALTGGAVIWQQRAARDEAQSLQDRQVERVQSDLVKLLTNPVYGLKGARGTLAALDGKFNRTAFRAYVASRDLPRVFPGAYGFGFIQPVADADLDSFVARQRSTGAPDYRLRRLGPQSPHYLVVQTEPAATNEAAWGIDTGADAARRVAIDRAVETGEPALSNPVTLVQDPQHGAGFLLYVPVYQGIQDPGTPQLRRERLLGLLYAPLIAREVLQGAMEPVTSALDMKLTVRAVDGRDVPLLATRDGAGLSQTEAADYDLSDATLVQTQHFTIHGSEFTLHAALNQATVRTVLGLSGVALEVGGALLSLMLSVTAYLLVAGRARAEAMARGMTADLERLARVARHTTNAVFITDARHRISWINDGFTRLTGYTLEEVVGKHPGKLLQSERADPAAEAVLRAAVEAGEGAQVELINRAKDGHHYWVAIEIQPLKDAQGELTGYMVIESDISVRKQLQAQADEARQSLQDLYDNAPCAYYSLDGDGRFLQINAVGLAWFGCTAEEAIGQLRSADFLTDEGRALFASHFPRFKAEGFLTGLELDLIGRHGPPRRVSLSATAVYDDQGQFLRSRTVMYDITETHRIRQQLHQLTLDQEAMLDSDLVGIVKIRDRKSLWNNHELERMFGYAQGELRGTSTRLIYPDDTSFHAVGATAYPMLKAGGRYRTQLQMVRKDGTPIWVDMAGIELPGSDGDTLWMLLDITQAKAHEARMERAALHDALTGLPNRLLLGDRLHQAIHSAERGGHLFALAYLDLNGFKQINDPHGHDAGDEVLKAVAARLQAGVRATDTVARLGGDEFVVLLTPATTPAEAELVLGRLLDAISQPIKLGDGTAVAVGSSLGLAHFPGHGRTAEVLMRHADEEMFANKRAGRRRTSASKS